MARPADACSGPPVAPVSPQYTLLRVKRKRDDNPVVSLILAGETDHQAGSKRSALTDIRTLLNRTRIADDDNKEAEAAEEDSSHESRRPTATLRRVFKLVGTLSHAASSPDDALLARIEAMQTARQARAVHPSIAPASRSAQQRERQIEAQQQRAAAARTERLKEARAATSTSSAFASSASPAASAPFTFLDVNITKHFPVSSSTPTVSAHVESSAALRVAPAERPVVAETAVQEHRDHLFSRAMSIVKAMPDKEKMAAYASLLDDYWQATASSTETQQLSFTQQLQQHSTQPAAVESPPQPKPRVIAGERIDLSSLAPNAQRLYAGAATSQRHHVISSEDESQYVYDVYRVEADSDMDDTAARGGEAETEGEVASVVVDSRVAGWFGLVIDGEDVLDSDEDDEDENREGWEGNDYPDEEDDEEDDEDEDEQRGREEQRMEAGDQDEEFYRLRQELKRSKNELIVMSEEEEEEDDSDDDEEDDGEVDEYVHSHRQYRAGRYDNEI